jgi:hypothetical protein
VISPPLRPLCSTTARSEAGEIVRRQADTELLNRRTPTPAYTARPEAVPTGTPIDTGHYRVRRIDPSGVISLRHNSRLHHIGLGRRHAEPASWSWSWSWPATAT